MERAFLIFNPKAGLGRVEDRETILEQLSQRWSVEVLETSKERDADECAREALSRNPDLIVAAGGDGTLSAVASVMVEEKSSVPLGIIPRGTACSVSKALNIPQDLVASCQTIIEGKRWRIDTARCNEQTCVLLVAIGFHADAVGETTRESKNTWGRLAYVASGIQQLMSLEPFRVELETEDQVIRCDATAVTVANVAPDTTVLAQGPAVISPDDGLLDVTIVCATTLAETVATGLHLLRTAQNNEPATRENVGHFAAKKLMVRTDVPRRAIVDGEEGGETPLTIECLPKSLTVIVPAILAPRVEVQEKLDGLPNLEVEAKV